MRYRLLRTLTLLAASAVGSVSLQEAAEGRVPITGPTTITARGQYVVTQNITGSGTLITISADDVDVDLNGFTLEETSLLSPVINGSYAERLSIHDGSLVGGRTGVTLTRGHNSRLTNLTVLSSAENGISVTATHDFTIEGCLIEEPGAIGISIASQTERGFGVIKHNTILRANFEGILVSDMVAGVIESNVIRGGSRSGLFVLSGDALLVRDNIVDGSAGYGLHVDNSSGSSIVENSARGTSSAGVVIGAESDGNYVGRNLVSDSSSQGLTVTGSHTYVVENWLLGNTSWGLNFNASQSVYRENTSRGNTGTAAACLGAGGTTDFCDSGIQNTTAGDNYLPARQ